MPFGYVNPTNDGNNNYVQNDGSTAINNTSTVVNSGTAKGLYSNRDLLDNSGHGLRDNSKYGSEVVAGVRKAVGAANWSAVQACTAGTDVIGNTTYVKITDSTHGRSVGDIVNILDTNNKINGVARIIVVDDANNFTVNTVNVAGSGTVTYHYAQGNFATMTAGAYIIRRVTTTLAGVANTVLRSGGNNTGYVRSIHKVENAFRHTGVATAIRAGYYDMYSGTFTTAPTETNNSIGNVSGSTVTDGTADHAATPTYATPGELVYRESGKPTSGNGGAKQADYAEKTGG